MKGREANELLNVKVGRYEKKGDTDIDILYRLDAAKGDININKLNRILRR